MTPRPQTLRPFQVGRELLNVEAFLPELPLPLQVLLHAASEQSHQLHQQNRAGARRSEDLSRV